MADQTQAVIYGRHSPKPREQVAKTESIETQFERCEAYCQAHGLEIVGHFEDRSKTGANADREGLQEALDAACKAKAVLVVYSLTRLARDAVDAVTICERLHGCGAGLALLDLRIDTTTAACEMVLTIMAAVAKLERRQIGARTSDAMLRHQSAGRRMSSNCPYGWEPDPDSPISDKGLHVRMRQNPAEQVSIRRILELVDAGLGWRAIARHLDAEGHTARGDNGWRHQTVKLIAIREAG